MTNVVKMDDRREDSRSVTLPGSVTLEYDKSTGIIRKVVLTGNEAYNWAETMGIVSALSKGVNPNEMNVRFYDDE